MTVTQHMTMEHKFQMLLSHNNQSFLPTKLYTYLICSHSSSKNVWTYTDKSYKWNFGLKTILEFDLHMRTILV